ncbi:GDP-mannose 4,6-dehydratase [Candidatus Pacearchaeota archaeon]|nr:GDP-mannose 4,6-dehydratase [Candidatus Pacearchaeota archaeon]|tara:strand:- start:5255 stop:6232 length:978 start_codon:yes stop_codon:yes gene_type:complete
MRKALITGINGQDGSYLTELLLEGGYEVHGILKRNSVAENQTARLDDVYQTIKDNLYYADMTDMASLVRVLQGVQPDEIYNLAAQSHVRISFDQPIYTTQTVAVGTMNLLEAIRLMCPNVRMYQASSSEMFGNSFDEDGFQRETTPMYPTSPYGCAKVFGYNLVRNYRHAYNLFLSNGILFNHESPRRGTNFVTNKVVKEAVKIKHGITDKLMLGNLEATRDWGHAKDYVRAMRLILQQDEPSDYVCSTGISHTVKELCDYTFSKLDLDYKDYVGVDEKYYRPEELTDLKGDSSKLKSIGFEAEYTFETMLDEMINFWVDFHIKF